MQMLSANSLPLLLDMPSVLIGAWRHSHQNAAVVDASFILFGTLFRDAPIAKRSNKAKRQASRASGRQCDSYRPRGIKPGSATTPTAMMAGMMVAIVPPMGPPSSPPSATLRPSSVSI